MAMGIGLTKVMTMGNCKAGLQRKGCIRQFLMVLFVFGASLVLSPDSVNAEGIGDTKHNLSATGPGTIRALTESRICVFCHTPHNATPETPLWNREIQARTYDVYASPTLKAGRSGGLPQPSGPTKLCLGCHDGTIATLGAVLNPAGVITMAGSATIPLGSLSNIGTNLSNHHPVSFSYYDALPNAELVATPPAHLVFGGTGNEVHCSTCHNPHDDTNGMFLAMDNRRSALCVSCHQIDGWTSSAHATSAEPVEGILPRPPNVWPTSGAWPTVADWGCEVCHTPHFAVTTSPWLLNFSSTDYCLSCHSPVPGPLPPHLTMAKNTSPEVRAASRTGMRKMADIRGQIKKRSSHGGQSDLLNLSLHDRKGSLRSTTRDATCLDCHNAHVANKRKASPPNASGMLQGVRGVDRNGAEIASVYYEYEVCFKCHGDYSPDFPFVPRVVNTTNARLEFDPINPSYHPVVQQGKNLNIPSIPSSYEPSLNASNVIYCTDCHRDDAGGAKGPHGSQFAPILRERYQTTDNTPESYDNYSLCYRCHNRTSILNDVSFRKKTRRTTASGGGHSGHLAAGAPCSLCHDAHGVTLTSPMIGSDGTGSHTHLINFDTRTVLPIQGNRYPVFHDTGTFSGSCTLICHGRVHTINDSYP